MSRLEAELTVRLIDGTDPGGFDGSDEAATRARNGAWTSVLSELSRPEQVLGAARALQALGLPLWEERHFGDVRPARALEAARMCIHKPNSNSVAYAKAAAKGCTQARRETLGYGHRIAEAARHLAVAATKSDPTAECAEALGRLEEHLKYELSIVAVYDRDDDIRGAIWHHCRST